MILSKKLAGKHTEVDDDPHDTTNLCSTTSGDAQPCAQAAVSVRL